MRAVAQEDRERWNAKYRAGERRSPQPSPALVSLASWIPREGRALDVAGGAGANAVWLARRGLAVTVADISEVGLACAVALSVAHGVRLQTEAVDLEAEPLPAGPWALVLCCCYLQRDLIGAIAQALAPGGRLVWIHPTLDNLTRHARPGRRFLLRPGEAVELVERAGLRVCVAEEGWVGPGESARCLARLVAQRDGISA